MPADFTPPTSAAPQAGARSILRLEGAAIFIAAVAGYATLDFGWIFFAILLLAPDLSMLGYTAGPRTGAVVYNAAHSYMLPALIAALGWFLVSTTFFAVALIWTAHIGMDRMLGYGLKLPTGFRDTHLGTIGKDG